MVDEREISSSDLSACLGSLFMYSFLVAWVSFMTIPKRFLLLS